MLRVFIKKLGVFMRDINNFLYILLFLGKRAEMLRNKQGF